MKLNKLLNIEYPLIQGGMANIATGEFAASVSNAGATWFNWCRWNGHCYIKKEY